MNSTHCIQTGVDKLLELIQDSQEISLTQASNHLQVPKNVVLKWAHMLENEDLVCIKETLRDQYFLSRERNEFSTGMFMKTRHFFKSLFKRHKYFHEEALKKQAKDLKAREKALESQLSKLHKKAMENNELRVRLENDKKELEEEMQRCEEKKQELESFKERLQDREHVLTKQRSLLKERQIEVQERFSELDNYRMELENKDERLRMWQNQLRKAAKNLIEGIEKESGNVNVETRINTTISKKVE